MNDVSESKRQYEESIVGGGSSKECELKRQIFISVCPTMSWPALPCPACLSQSYVRSPLLKIWHLRSEFKKNIYMLSTDQDFYKRNDPILISSCSLVEVNSCLPSSLNVIGKNDGLTVTWVNRLTTPSSYRWSTKCMKTTRWRGSILWWNFSFLFN